MKVRSGFVSNSSSCSFVIVGVKIADKDKRLDRKDMEKMMKKVGFDWTTMISKYNQYGNLHTDDDLFAEMYEEDFIYGHLAQDGFVYRAGSENGVKGVVVGKELATSEEWGFDCQTLDPQDIVKIGKEVKEKFKVKGKAKLFIGTMMC